MGRRLQDCVIVFDLDGTLVDTAPDLLRALNQTLAMAGLAPAPEAAVRGFVGHGARAMLLKATAAAPLPEARLGELVNAFIDFYAADIAASSRPFPGAVDALDALAEDGARLAVCTNKRQGLSEKLLSTLGLAERFAAIVGADAVANRKPAAEHYIAAVERAGGTARRSLMVGDSEADVGAARAAGVGVVAVRFGYSLDADALGADAVIDHFDALPALARRLLA